MWLLQSPGCHTLFSKTHLSAVACQSDATVHDSTPVGEILTIPLIIAVNFKITSTNSPGHCPRFMFGAPGNCSCIRPRKAQNFCHPVTKTLSSQNSSVHLNLCAYAMLSTSPLTFPLCWYSVCVRITDLFFSEKYEGGGGPVWGTGSWWKLGWVSQEVVEIKSCPLQQRQIIEASCLDWQMPLASVKVNTQGIVELELSAAFHVH